MFLSYQEDELLVTMRLLGPVRISDCRRCLRCCPEHVCMFWSPVLLLHYGLGIRVPELVQGCGYFRLFGVRGFRASGFRPDVCLLAHTDTDASLPPSTSHEPWVDTCRGEVPCLHCSGILSSEAQLCNVQTC